MKITRYFMAAALLLTMTACDSDLEKVVYNPESATPGTLTAVDGVTDIVLTAANKKSDVLTLEWGESDFGQSVAVKYSVMLDVRGGDFTKAYTMAATTKTTATFTGNDLNKAVLALQKLKDSDAEPSYEPMPVDIRIFSEFSEIVDGLNTNIIQLTITPYAGKIEYPKLAVPGSHQGWDPANYAQALYATNSKKPNVYTGYIYMDAGTEFKFADGSWDVNWGSSDGKTLEPGGSNIYVAEAGCYYITVDTEALTYSMEIRNWSLIGDAVGGWDKDLDMEYDKANNVYRATYKFTGEGEFKFRANHDWGTNYGSDNDGDPGDLKLDGGNIKPLAGEYTVTLSFMDGYPTYTLFAGSEIDNKPYNFLSLPGTLNGWDPATKDNVIIDESKKGTYTGWVYCTDDDEFKIADGSWDSNWGSADLTTLEPGGANIKPGAGMYEITANIDELTLKMTKHDWSIVGSAVGGDTSWGTDYDLTWNADTKVLEGTFELAAGELKFRADKDWALNFGGNGEEGGLKKNGDNIAVEAGTYHITLDLHTAISHLTPTYTITKQQ